MRILLIHQNFPGQFKRLAQTWVKQPGWQVIGLGRNTAPGLPDVPWVRYQLHRSIGKEQHPYLRKMEDAVLHGQAVARSLLDLKRKGFQPDVVLAHPGWGETLYVRDVFPDARLVHFCEWYYGTPNSDMGFDPAYPSDFNAQARARTWNALHALNLTHCDVGVSPTEWQRSRHPEIFQPKIHLAHEGVDTGILKPDSAAQLKMPNGQVLSAGQPVITYVARNLEPYRGFPSFMRMLAKVQQSHKQCHTIIVGGDDVSYGSKPKDAANWREKMLQEVPSVDPSRTHFLGKVPYDVYRKVLQVSAAHVYLTYPFVLSWSMLEAMASGCLIIGSRTAPVQEVIQHGENGLLVDFFDHNEIADTVASVLEQPHSFSRLREKAQTTIAANYTMELGEQQYRKLLQA
ncbi:MAG: glycosyltransferase family 4 protein [Aquabacterium sp.]|nr:glycosyltransferase family 4 protein [Aquabacterium sp.]